MYKKRNCLAELQNSITFPYYTGEWKKKLDIIILFSLRMSTATVILWFLESIPIFWKWRERNRENARIRLHYDLEYQWCHWYFCSLPHYHDHRKQQRWWWSWWLYTSSTHNRLRFHWLQCKQLSREDQSPCKTGDRESSVGITNIDDTRGGCLIKFSRHSFPSMNITLWHFHNCPAHAKPGTSTTNLQHANKCKPFFRSNVSWHNT